MGPRIVVDAKVIIGFLDPTPSKRGLLNEAEE
jgi:hypothetical protein